MNDKTKPTPPRPPQSSEFPRLESDPRKPSPFPRIHTSPRTIEIDSEMILDEEPVEEE